MSLPDLNGGSQLIDPAEITRYHESGFLVPRLRISDPLLNNMRTALEELIAENRHIRPELLVLRWGGGKKALPVHNRFLEYAKNPEILNIVGQLLGPDVICWGAHVFCKPGGDGLEVPWHQDGQYWPIRPLATCTVWIALDASTPENGCLQVVPGSHRMKSVYHHRLDERPGLAIDQVIDDERFDENSAVPVVLEAGQMSIHDVYMIHGSAPNNSNKRRAGLAIRYMPATSLYDRTIKRQGGAAAIRQDMSLRPIYLVRGQDHAGNDFDVGQDHPFRVGDA